MKKKSQLFCTAAAFLIAVQMMSGCDSKQTQTDEIQEIADSTSTSTETLDDIQTSAKATESISEITDAVDQVKTDPNESDENKRNAELNQKLYPSADNICCFTVKTVWNGENEYWDDLYLLHTEGKWKVSIFCSDSAVSPLTGPDGFEDLAFKYRTEAQNAYNAMATALIELGDYAYNVTDINETLTYHGSDFANLKPTELKRSDSSDVSEALAILPGRLSCYSETIDEADTVVFAIENGSCLAAAWKLEDGNYDVYPYSGEQKEYSSAEEAFAAVKEYQSNMISIN